MFSFVFFCTLWFSQCTHINKLEKYKYKNNSVPLLYMKHPSINIEHTYFKILSANKIWILFSFIDLPLLLHCQTENKTESLCPEI